MALIKFANGGISITESSWSMKGGMELRNEITGTGGRLVTDTTETPVHGFITNPAGYLMEKADAETGFVYPIPEEARVYGYAQEMRHFVDCFRDGAEPRETFVDGYVVNCALDACYRSMKSGTLGADRARPGHRGMSPTATARYIDLVRDLLDRVADQDAELDRAADLCADAIGSGGLVHLFGTGPLAHGGRGDVPALRLLSRASIPSSSCPRRSTRRSWAPTGSARRCSSSASRASARSSCATSTCDRPTR